MTEAGSKPEGLSGQDYPSENRPSSRLQTLGGKRVHPPTWLYFMPWVTFDLGIQIM